jgi:hypothetical protein
MRISGSGSSRAFFRSASSAAFNNRGVSAAAVATAMPGVRGAVMARCNRSGAVGSSARAA